MQAPTTPLRHWPLGHPSVPPPIAAPRPLQFQFSLEEAEAGGPDARCTLMIRNIPNKCVAVQQWLLVGCGARISLAKLLPAGGRRHPSPACLPHDSFPSCLPPLRPGTRRWVPVGGEARVGGDGWGERYKGWRERKEGWEERESERAYD